MSVFGDIIDDVLADFVVAVPTLTTVRKFVVDTDIANEDLPHCQAYQPAYEVVEQLDARQEARNYGFTVLISDRDTTQEALLTLIESIEAQLAADRRLADTVTWVFLSGVQINEVPDPQTKLQTILAEVVVELVV